MGPVVATTLYVLSLVGSVFLLWKGADWLVDGASRIARRLHISELVIGLTLVAAGTSAPEFAVSIGAALSGQSDISVGNVVGSNIFNLGFILGGCAIIRPITTSRALVYRDGIFLVLVTVGVLLCIGDGVVSRIEGLIMLGALVGYFGFLYLQRASVGEEEDNEGPEAVESGSNLKDILLVLFSLGVVIGGSKLLVYGASGIARTLGMSEWAIGVTVVAAGTSAPEVVTSRTAVLKGRHGISAGGLLGSDIYNFLGVLGLAAFIHPLSVAGAGQESIVLLIGMVLVALIFMRTGWRLSRPEGSVLLTIAGIRWIADMLGLSLLG